MNLSKLIKDIGQLFVIGFSEDVVSPVFLAYLKEIEAGGVILFENNCSSSESIEENISKIKACYSGKFPLIAIDQEGGDICRIKRAPAGYSSPAEYGNSKNMEKFEEDYSRTALYLKSIGVSLNLAPVADLSLNEENKWLNERCFSSDPEVASKFVASSVEISKKSGILSCLKHFPGLGASVVDPHRELSTVDYNYNVWEQRERLVFEAGIKAGADFVMTSHVLANELDSEIVTVSEKIISECLRDKLSFEGPVITDDLSMKGAESVGDIGERTVMAFNAGHDLLLFGQDFEVTIEAFEYFINAVERGEISKERLQASLGRISGTKIKLGSSVLS